MRRLWPILGTVLLIVIPTLPRHLLGAAGPCAPRRRGQASRSRWPCRPSRSPTSRRRSTRRRWCSRALAKPATVKFAETTLKDVVKWLQDDQKLGVLLDTKALTDGRVLMERTGDGSAQQRTALLAAQSPAQRSASRGTSTAAWCT